VIFESIKKNFRPKNQKNSEKNFLFFEKKFDKGCAFESRFFELFNVMSHPSVFHQQKSVGLPAKIGRTAKIGPNFAVRVNQAKGTEYISGPGVAERRERDLSDFVDVSAADHVGHVVAQLEEGLSNCNHSFGRLYIQVDFCIWQILDDYFELDR
jgi:hypothetical protein